MMRSQKTLKPVRGPPVTWHPHYENKLFFRQFCEGLSKKICLGPIDADLLKTSIAAHENLCSAFPASYPVLPPMSVDRQFVLICNQVRPLRPFLWQHAQRGLEQ